MTNLEFVTNVHKLSIYALFIRTEFRLPGCENVLLLIYILL